MMLDDPKPDNDRDWPHDQRYANICRACYAELIQVTDDLAPPQGKGPPAHQFFGPKRAPFCWKHAGSTTREWWLTKFQQA